MVREDYHNTFSPMVKVVSIRLILTIVIMRGWKLCQVDISNASLHGRLKERIVLSQPSRFVNETRPHHVCLLNRALYSLKHAMAFEGFSPIVRLRLWLGGPIVFYLLLWRCVCVSFHLCQRHSRDRVG